MFNPQTKRCFVRRTFKSIGPVLPPLAVHPHTMGFQLVEDLEAPAELDELTPSEYFERDSTSIGELVEDEPVQQQPVSVSIEPADAVSEEYHTSEPQLQPMDNPYARIQKAQFGC